MADEAILCRSYAQTPPKFIAGVRGIDFVNTVEWRGDPRALVDRLSRYEELASWCASAGLIEAAGADRLIEAGKRQPRRARRVLRQAVALRETVAALLRQAEPFGGQQRSALNLMLQAVRCCPTLQTTADGAMRCSFAPTGPMLDRLFGIVALEVAALLTSGQLARVRSCLDPRCGWMFLDTSRNRSRRWCDMATCGNRAKARAHYARREADGAPR